MAAAPVGASQETAKAPAAKPAAKAPKSIDLTKLPPPVRATIESETRNATLKHVSKETEKGQTQYEVETTVNGKTRDLLVDPAGKLIEVEEEIAVNAAPQPVQDALKTRGKVLRLEAVQRGGKTFYEASVQGKSGKKSSVALDADGKPHKG
jgi:uncharacterized membrane protein YkoI